jgi:hypothetical protein
VATIVASVKQLLDVVNCCVGEPALSTVVSLVLIHDRPTNGVTHG